MSLPGLADSFGSFLQQGDGVPGQHSSFGLTLATVKNIKDDQNLNRVKCLPITAKDEELSEWCYVMTPMSGAQRGLFLFPQVGDLVVLAYLNHDPHSPIVLGGFWNSESKPPLAVKDGKAEDYCLITPQHVELTLHDEEKKQKLTVKMPSGIVVEIDDEKQTLSAKSSDGSTALEMKMKDGEAELKAKSKLTLSAGNASVVLDKNGNIAVKGSGGAVTLEGKKVEGKAQGTLSLQGMDASVQATKDLKLSATGTASLKGTMLKLN